MSIKIENEQIRKILKNAPPDIARRIMEMFWDELGDIPVDDDGILQESFLWWPKGTDREDIWHWFDDKYPGGVAKLMGLTNDNYIHEATEFFNSLAKLADNAKE